MNADRLLRDTFREWAEETPPPAGPDLAGRALLRRRRRRATALTVAAAAFALLAGGVAVPVLAESGQPGYSGPGQRMPNDVSAYPRESPPRHLIAAGDVAVSAYQADRKTRKRAGSSGRPTPGICTTPGRSDTRRRPGAGWTSMRAWGGRRSSRTLPASRVGILDMSTGDVTKWIPLKHKAGGVQWSPDGERLVVTTYSGYPDSEASPGSGDEQTVPMRTGYYVVDGLDGVLADPQGHLVGVASTS